MLCLGQLMVILDVSVVNVALPAIPADLNFSQAGLAWVADAYLIAFGGLLLLCGRLGDLLGRHDVLLAEVTVFSCRVAGLRPMLEEWAAQVCVENAETGGRFARRAGAPMSVETDPPARRRHRGARRPAGAARPRSRTSGRRAASA